MRPRIAGVVIGALFITAPAWADDSAAGAVLFKEARALMEQRKYAEACAKFDAARALVPNSAGALLSLADCQEVRGLPATAYGLFKDAGMLAHRLNDADREAEAKRRAELVEPKLSKLSILVQSGNRGVVTVRRNGNVVPDAALGSAIPLDPGEHTVDASSPGKQTYKVVVHVEARPGTTTLIVPVLRDAPEPVGASASSSWGAQRISGVALAGAGVVGIVVGSVFGARTYQKNSDSKTCDAQGVALRNEAYSAATTSTVAFVAGSVLLAAGAITSFTAPSASPKPAVELRAGLGMLSVRGEW